MRVGKGSMKKKHYWKKCNAKTKMKFIMKLSFSYCFKICMRVDKGNMKKNHYQVKFKQGNDKKKRVNNFARFFMKLSFSYCFKICMKGK